MCPDVALHHGTLASCSFLSSLASSILARHQLRCLPSKLLTQENSLLRTEAPYDMLVRSPTSPLGHWDGNLVQQASTRPPLEKKPRIFSASWSRPIRRVEIRSTGNAQQRTFPLLECHRRSIPYRFNPRAKRICGKSSCMSDHVHGMYRLACWTFRDVGFWIYVAPQTLLSNVKAVECDRRNSTKFLGLRESTAAKAVPTNHCT